GRRPEWSVGLWSLVFSESELSAVKSPPVLLLRNARLQVVCPPFSAKKLQVSAGFAEKDMMKRLLALSAVLAVPSGAGALGIRLFDHDAFATSRGDAFVA